jgi:hypothetical protein
MGYQSLLNSDKYLRNSYPFPSDDVSPEKKGEAEWNLAWLNAIVYQYLDNKCGVRYNQLDKIQELRDYAEGRQSGTKYKNFFLGKEIPGEQRKGWMNVNFDDIFSPAPKIKSKIMGIMESQEHDVLLDATDEKSGAEKERAKEMLWFKKKYKTILDEIDQTLGIPPKDEVLPESREELELFAGMGGFKLPYEVFMEKCLGHTFDISNHPENKRNIIGDLIDINMAATMDYVNTEEQKVYEKYIDIADLIIDYDGSNNFANARYGAIPMSYTIADIEAETGLSEEKILKIAQSFAGKYGNPVWSDSFNVKAGNVWKFNNWRIPVIYGAYKTVNNKYHTKKNGKMYPATYGKVWDTDTKKTVITNVQVVYHAKWIPETDFMWDYGIMNDIPRNEKGAAGIPFHVYKLKGKSIMEQLLPILDDIQMIKLRYQNGIAKAPPPGIAVEIESLENIMFGSKKMKPLEVIAMYLQSGSYVYRDKPATGGSNASQAKPFEVLAGGAGTVIQETAASMTMAFNQIAQITGIDPVTLTDETMQPDNTLGGKQLALASTNNTLKGLYSAYISIKESFSRNAASRINLICMFNKDDNKGYYGVIGSAGVESIRAMENNKISKLGIHIHARPTEFEKANVLEAAKSALALGKSGAPGITMSQYLFISRQINMPGGIKYCEAMLSYWESKKQKEELELAKVNMEQNKSLEVDAVMKKSEAEKSVIIAQADQDIRVYAAKAVIDGKVKQQDFQMELQKLGVQAALDTEQQQELQPPVSPMQQ